VSPVKYELGFYIPEDDILDYPLLCLVRILPEIVRARDSASF
jgi:hypothetical protein